MDGISLLAKAGEICPEMSVVIITGHGNMEMAIQALRLGAADFLTKPIKFLDLDAVLEKSVRLRTLRQDKRRLRETIRGIQKSGSLHTVNLNFVGTSPITRKVREQIKQAVEAGCETILITGETGTGKEVVARNIHFQAGSDESPFIAVSCPSLPDTLVESELFGHTKGAFTGATDDKAGYFELADGGTLFLDEIADLSASAQANLLRVLETRMLRRVGGSKEISVNVRVITATNNPLEQLVEESKFRPDLFYRLNVYSIHLSPLRERREDILPLAEHFLSTYATSRNLRFDGFSPEAQKLLLNYDFPGNARELRNIVERAAILCRSDSILPEHLNLPEHSGSFPERRRKTKDDISSQSIQPEDNNERTRILSALQETKWNRRQAAKKLGIPYSTLRYKIQKLGIA
jgi:DNA-binding NtrC family response regulator